jgi:hypothetical protein
MSITLDCPLCGATVADGLTRLDPGRCPGCAARYEGDGEGPLEGVAAALAALGAADLDTREVAEALFALDPALGEANAAGVASDSREGFYRWWVFVRDDAVPAREALTALIR